MNWKNKATLSTIILVIVPLALVSMAAVYLFRSSRAIDGSDSNAGDKPDAYSEQTFDHVPDPTQTPVCVEDMSSYELIKDSDYLKESGLRIWIGGSVDNGLKIPKACSSKEKGPFSVITRTGLSAVIENLDNTEVSTLEWECGGQVPAQKFLFKGDEAHDESLFLISGDKAEQVLEWHAAKEMPGNNLCVGADPDYQVSENLSYEITDLKWKYSVQKWKYKGSETEACNASVAALDRLVLNQKSACERQLESQFNCEGLALDGNTDPDIGKILGVLTIHKKSDSSETENWLILESPGYEWRGYSVSPLDSRGRLDKKRLKTLVYSGC